MPIQAPKKGSTASAPNFRFSASMDHAQVDALQAAAQARSKHAARATAEAVAAANLKLMELTVDTAQQLRAMYAAEGFNIPVEARKNGRFYTIAVTGDAEAQKWARLLEVGHGPVNVLDSLPTARRRRAIQVMRVRKTKTGDKVYMRGGDEKEEGWYVVVPIVKGRIVSKNGKLTFQRNLRGGLPESAGKYGKDHVSELDAAGTVPTGAREIENHDGRPSVYRTGEAGMLGPGEARGKPTTVLPQYRPRMPVTPELQALADSEPRRVTEAVVKGRLTMKKNPHYDAELRARDEAKAAIYGLQDVVEARKLVLKRMGIPDAVVRSYVQPTEHMIEVANAGGELGSQMTTAVTKHVQFRGDVVSFRRVSTRGKGWVRPGRPGKYLLAGAQAHLRREIQAEITRVTSRGRPTIAQEAYAAALRAVL